MNNYQNHLEEDIYVEIPTLEAPLVDTTVTVRIPLREIGKFNFFVAIFRGYFGHYGPFEVRMENHGRPDRLSNGFSWTHYSAWDIIARGRNGYVIDPISTEIVYEFAYADRSVEVPEDEEIEFTIRAMVQEDMLAWDMSWVNLFDFYIHFDLPKSFF